MNTELETIGLFNKIVLNCYYFIIIDDKEIVYNKEIKRWFLLEGNGLPIFIGPSKVIELLPSDLKKILIYNLDLFL